MAATDWREGEQPSLRGTKPWRTTEPSEKHAPSTAPALERTGRLSRFRIPSRIRCRRGDGPLLLPIVSELCSGC